MANTKMWARALRTIPKVTDTEWRALDLISKWLIATRSAVFIMTALAAGIGGLLAYRFGSFSWLNFVLCMVGLIFAHASNNLINDYVDHLKGIDKDNYYRSQYGPQPLEHGLMTKSQFLVYILITLSIAIGAGIWLVYLTGTITLYLLLAGLFFLLFYTWPLKYIGLGEPTVILVWGPLMIAGTYYVVSGGHISSFVIWFSLVYALGPTTVLFGKHTDKLQEDKAKRVYTLPVILGEFTARWSTILFWILQYAIIIWFVIAQAISPFMLICLLAIPKLLSTIKVFSKPRPAEAPADLPPNTWPLYLSAHAFVYNRQFGLLFLLGLILDLLYMKIF